MPQTIDPLLIDRARRRDQAALGQLLEGQKKRLFHIVFHMLGHLDDAIKVTQDSMQQVVEHIGDSKRQADIAVWIVGLAMNLSLSLLRHRQLRPTSKLVVNDVTVVQDQLSPLRQQLADGHEHGPESCLGKAQRGGHLQTCLDRLPDDLRAVLLLRDLDDMDYHQIAQALAIPIETVKRRLFRARLALRKELGAIGRLPDRSIESPREPQQQRQRAGMARQQSSKSFAPKGFNDG